MNILITGGNGFIARNIYKKLKGIHKVYLTNRQTLDVLDKSSVKKFFKENEIDIVIHTAVSGGRRGKEDDIQTLIDNLTMFKNLIAEKKKGRFDALIHFGSGAEFDRRTDNACAKEDTDSNPLDYYGLSKKIIKRELDNEKGCFNLRIFGCFGVDEDDTRFIKSAIKSVKEGNPIRIHQNRYMDFISIEDVCLVVDHYVQNIRKKTLPKDINLCYNSPKSLLDIANKINKLMDNPSDNVIIEQEGYYTEYTGNGERLKSLGLKLTGLDEGLKRCINV